MIQWLSWVARASRPCEAAFKLVVTPLSIYL